MPVMNNAYLSQGRGLQVPAFMVRSSCCRSLLNGAKDLGDDKVMKMNKLYCCSFCGYSNDGNV